jgi:succinylglutamic semialdehyde dehydrogenase|tara:strand:+ start:141 stop:1511 length:1371 start_codon:yes stop_codon:yes gene_type:complete
MTSSRNEINEKFKNAKLGFGSWRKTTLQHRKTILTKYKEILSANSALLAETISKEHGKPLWDSKSEVGAMIGKIDVTFESYDDRLNAIRSVHADISIQARFKPFGVFAVIGPFNFPGHLPNGHIVPLLLAGNSVIFKPSSLTPRTGKLIVQYLHDAGVPTDVVTLCEGHGHEVVEHPLLDGVFFTGSTKVGHGIYKRLSDYPEKIVALEMGGNNATIIEEASGINSTVNILLQSAFISTGQRCTCTRRLIVNKGLTACEGDRIIRNLVDAADKLLIGEYTDTPEPFMGPMITLNAVKGILDAQKHLVSLGGVVIKEFKQINGVTSKLVEPGIIDVTNIKNLPDEEYFGPLLQVIRSNDFDHAIEIANDTKYGLVSGVITKNKNLFWKAEAELKTGIVNWNRPTTGCASVVPFGGTGWSGNNRPSGYTTIEHCGHPTALHLTEVPELPSTLLPGITL